MKIDDYKPVLVNLEEVPAQQRPTLPKWKERFANIPSGKAAMLQFNNQQRAHQERKRLQESAHVHKVKIRTRTIHATKEIHGTEGWLLYFWKEGK